MDSFSNIPINRYLGFKLISRSSESASISMEPRSEFLQEEGVIHEAIVTALARYCRGLHIPPRDFT